MAASVRFKYFLDEHEQIYAHKDQFQEIKFWDADAYYTWLDVEPFFYLHHLFQNVYS